MMFKIQKLKNKNPINKLRKHMGSSESVQGGIQHTNLYKKKH